MMKKLLFVIYLFVTLSKSFGQSHTNLIVVDQFGYRTTSEKIAVIRDPKEGFDASVSFSPGSTLALINNATGATVYEAAPSIWNSGATDASSGDKCWWFDFSSVNTPGSYHVLDAENNLKSFDFEIGDDVYAEVLKQAMRTFFYQRAGYAKAAPYAQVGWTDGASHAGALQDGQARRFDAKFLSFTERDLSGGWYDAGDYNKYTSWTANYIIEFLQAYEENEDAWGDNYCLPYSGNGIPDIIDEAKWGLDFLLRLQEDDGSLISVVSLDHAYPPSAAQGQSLYGAVNTSSSLAGAAAYAYAAKVFKNLGQTAFSDSLLVAGEKAWVWAVANPEVIWKNNDAEFNSVGIGAGQQEVDDYGRFAYKMRAAIHLFDATGKSEYQEFVDQNFQKMHLIDWSYAYPFEETNQEALLYYTSLPDATASVSSAIRDRYKASMSGGNNFPTVTDRKDPYMAYLDAYTWGSNNIKAKKGLMYIAHERYQIDPSKDDLAVEAAEDYIHYMHGLNPLNFCYLSNMYAFGADRGVTQFYHTWFADASDWDITGESKYGPPPGFLVGGANPSYDWDGCCTSTCTSNGCDESVRSMVIGQPDQKSYLDFNTSWPMNSWSLTENSCGYQVAYIRLLSKFVDGSVVASTSCNEETETPEPVDPPLKINKVEDDFFYPNPATDLLKGHYVQDLNVRVYNLQGALVLQGYVSSKRALDISTLKSGVYMLHYAKGSHAALQKLIVRN